MNRYYENFDNNISENRMNENALNINTNEIKNKNRDSQHKIMKKIL